MKQKNKSIAAIVNSSGELAKIKAQVTSLEQLNILIKQILPEELKNHCFVANLRDGVLLLATPTPEWSYKLKFAKYELLSEARKIPKFSGIKSIDIITQPEEIVEENKIDYLKSNMGALSEKTSDLVKQLAKRMPSEGLRAALEKIAKRTKDNTDHISY